MHESISNAIIYRTLALRAHILTLPHLSPHSIIIFTTNHAKYSHSPSLEQACVVHTFQSQEFHHQLHHPNRMGHQLTPVQEQELRGGRSQYLAPYSERGVGGKGIPPLPQKLMTYVVTSAKTHQIQYLKAAKPP